MFLRAWLYFLREFYLCGRSPGVNLFFFADWSGGGGGGARPPPELVGKIACWAPAGAPHGHAPGSPWAAAGLRPGSNMDSFMPVLCLYHLPAWNRWGCAGVSE